jgi:hypothetical protein
MMKLWLRLRRAESYESAVRCSSQTHPGVRFAVRRMSLGRRIELAESLRDLAQELEFHQAAESAREQVEAASITARIERAYLKWGLAGLTGLHIDGRPANADSLYRSGPEDLLREILDRIKSECGLSEDERKN